MTEPFWIDGMRFDCSGCSKCCRHEPGFVFLAADDIRRLIASTGLAFRDFLRKFTRLVDIGTGLAISLTETISMDCIFWNDGCTVYEFRPVQCSTYPFWERLLETEQTWLSEARDCPGIGKGPIISGDAIRACLVKRRIHEPVVVSHGLTLETIDEDSILGCQRFSANSVDPGRAQEQNFSHTPTSQP